MRVKHIVFAYNRELMHFIVKENKEVFYTDRKWGAFIRILPKPEDLISKIRDSRNRIPKEIGEVFNLTPAEQLEYEAAKTIEDLSNVIIRDAQQKGLKLIKNEEVKE